MVALSPLIISPGSDTGTALVRDRATQMPVRRDAAQIQPRTDDRLARRGPERALQRQAASANLRNNTVRDPLRRAPTADVQRWKQRIPPNALFYDEVGDITQGIGQPGLLVSVRV